MIHQNLALVTGGNGHLGNNLIRLLLNKGLPVRGSVRNLKNNSSFADLDCEMVQADVTDKQSLILAMQNVRAVYAVGAAFKLWAKDPKKEIYEVNLQGTKNLIEAAAESGVKRIVYVSSIAALNYSELPAKESNGQNPDRRDMYYNSKNDGEKLAFELARKHDIELVAVLPSAMIGDEAFGDLSVSYNIIKLILNKEIPVETNITLNWVDVKDIAMFSGLQQNFDISKAKNELTFYPHCPSASFHGLMVYPGKVHAVQMRRQTGKETEMLKLTSWMIN